MPGVRTGEGVGVRVSSHIWVWLCRVDGGFSRCGAGLLSVLASLAVECGSGVQGLRQLQLQSIGPTAVVRGLSCFAAWVSSRIRDQTCVACLGKQVLYH